MTSVLSLHWQIAKSRRQAHNRDLDDRWHPEHEIRRDRTFVSGAYFIEADCQRAINRMNRAVRRMRRLGRDASEIPNHIKQIAGLAHKQLAQTQKGAA